MGDHFKAAGEGYEIKAFHGDLGGIHRAYLINSFCSAVPSDHLNLRVLNTTSAGFCGINCKAVAFSGFDGIPMNLEDLSQFMERIRSADADT